MMQAFGGASGWLKLLGYFVLFCAIGQALNGMGLIR